MTYDMIKRNYDRGLWSAAMVAVAVRKGIITQAQYDAIISGEDETADLLEAAAIMGLEPEGE